MIRIGIIDDEKDMLNFIERKIKSINNFEDELEINSYLNAEDILIQLRDGEKYDVIFSDIQLKTMQGLHLGEIVRKEYPEIYFVFLTSFPEYAAKSYSINAYQYILKDEFPDRIENVLKSIVTQICEKRTEYRVLKVHNDMRKVFLKDIIYIKKIKSGKYVQYFTIDGELRERVSLEKVLREINNNDFIMIERGYVVNIAHIVRIKGNSIYLSNREEVIISRSRFSKVKEKISNRWNINDAISI